MIRKITKQLVKTVVKTSANLSLTKVALQIAIPKQLVIFVVKNTVILNTSLMVKTQFSLTKLITGSLVDSVENRQNKLNTSAARQLMKNKQNAKFAVSLMANISSSRAVKTLNFSERKALNLNSSTERERLT